MKTTSKTKKTSPTNSQSSKPFFNNSRKGTFFPNSKEVESPFFTSLNIQPKLTIGEPGDKYEQEADSMAEKVVQKMDKSNSTSVVQNKCEDCPQVEKLQKMEGEEMKISKKPIFESENGLNNNFIQGKGIDKVNPDIESQLQKSKGSGQAINKQTRQDMEQSFGADFTGVKIHTDSNAIQMNQNLGARAFANGNDIYFNNGEYNTRTKNGNKLLAHELTHVVQQQNNTAQPGIYRDIYTPEQRRAMSEGTVQGSQNDLALASQFGFQPGDIVFRLGSQELAARIGDPVTHGGVYLGNGLIHDMVAFGNRNVTVSNFYAEAADPSIVKVIRFTGPLDDIIVPRVVANIIARNFDLPTDTVPWNLFSSANDYRTATCLEYSHAQFLYAIRQISQESVWSLSNHSELQRTYFRGGAQQPSDLIQSRTLSVGGAMGIAINERRLLIAAADYLAEDVDPSVFENRWEGRETLENVGTSWAPTFYQQQLLESFTYRSFVDATRFFTVIR